jgi:hypothetical protein
MKLDVAALASRKPSSTILFHLSRLDSEIAAEDRVVDQPPCAQDELLLGVALAMEHHPELVRDDGPVQREDSPIGHAFNAPG